MEFNNDGQIKRPQGEEKTLRRESNDAASRNVVIHL